MIEEIEHRLKLLEENEFMVNAPELYDAAGELLAVYLPALLRLYNEEKARSAEIIAELRRELVTARFGTR